MFCLNDRGAARASRFEDLSRVWQVAAATVDVRFMHAAGFLDGFKLLGNYDPRNFCLFLIICYFRLLVKSLLKYVPGPTFVYDLLFALVNSVFAPKRFES